jgi:hypothetical protein
MPWSVRHVAPLALLASFAGAACDPETVGGGDDDPAETPPAPPGRNAKAPTPRTPAKVVRALDTAPARPQGPPLESLDVARAQGPRPTAAEFEGDGRPVLPATDAGNFCNYRELRGWLRVTCSTGHAGVFLLGGSSEGVALDATDDVAIVMPLARGDARIFQIAVAWQDYGGSAGLSGRFVLSETWVGTTGPHVVATLPLGGQRF